MSQSKYLARHHVQHVIQKYIAVAWGGVRIAHILKTLGAWDSSSPDRLRRHLGVSRHMPREDREDMRASEDTFPANTLVGARTRGRPKTRAANTFLAKVTSARKPCGGRHFLARGHMGKRRHFAKTGVAKTRGVAKTHVRAQALPEDRSHEDS